MTMSSVPLARPSFDEAEVEAVTRAFESGWVAGQGPIGRALEEDFERLTEVENAVAVANCTAALHLAMLVLGVGPGDEVIVADYTYPATGHSVLYAGATPVFVDVRPDIGTIEPTAIAPAVTPRTVGIIGVDALGQCADWYELRSIADAHGLFLVEDAACSVGATYRDRPAGSFADFACVSLHARKGVTSGEGGLILTNDAAWADKARSLSSFGTESALERAKSEGLPLLSFVELGYNYKLSDIAAAVARAQLAKLDGFLDRRRGLAALYGDALAGIPGISLPVIGADRDHTWQTFAVTLAPEIDRDSVAGRLRKAGIGCTIGTYASHLQPVYGTTRDCPVSASLFRSQLALPMFTDMSESDVARVAEGLQHAILAQATDASP